MCASKDLDLGLELPDSPIRFAQLPRLSCRCSGELAAIDPVLRDPVVEGGLGDVEISVGLQDRSSSPYESKCSSSELGRIGMWHRLHLSFRSNLNTQKGKESMGRSMSQPMLG